MDAPLPMLAKPLDDDDELDRFLTNDGWEATEKIDGERAIVTISNHKVSARTRQGQALVLPTAVRDELATLAGEWIFDGELLNKSTYHVFDVIASTKTSPATELYVRQAVRHMLADRTKFSSVTFMRGVTTEKAKRKLIDRIADQGGEGVVFKDLSTGYIPGRSLAWRKYKLWRSASCVVTQVPSGRGDKLSFEVSMLVPVGRVNVLTEIPEFGDVVEIRYLKAPSNRLVQPTHLCTRHDIDPAECTIDQLES